jgi:hypothetical protein
VFTGREESAVREPAVLDWWRLTMREIEAAKLPWAGAVVFMTISGALRA